MRIRLLFFVTFLVLLACPVLPLKAAGLDEARFNLDSAANTDTTGLREDLGDTIGLVVKAALAMVGTIFLLLTIYAGILWMTASGKEEQIETAQKIIKATVIGLFITMAAYAITFFVTSRLGGAGGGGVAQALSPVAQCKQRCIMTVSSKSCGNACTSADINVSGDQVLVKKGSACEKCTIDNSSDVKACGSSCTAGNSI
jgi:hypothetical protein